MADDKKALDSDKNNELFKYDIFVSYSHFDKKWTDEILLNKLKSSEMNILTDDDFEIGRPILKNIEDAVVQSRHTLIILTQSWIDSEWCDFEGLLSGTIDPAARQGRIIPLLVKDCDIPTRIRHLTYLDLRNNDSFDRNFQKLIDHVKNKKNRMLTPSQFYHPSHQ